MKRGKNCVLVLISFVFVLTFSGIAQAIIDGPCASCHTMHNSQDNLPMRFDSSVTPLPELLRGDCYGCHAQGTNNALEPLAALDPVPQVYHQDNTMLAGGNFAYIDGYFGSGASDGKGHNVPGLGLITADGTHTISQPGGIQEFGHDDGFLLDPSTLTCAGTGGCHGVRADASAVPVDGITGAHHDNVNGAVTHAANDGNPGHGYRFLQGVNGYEDTDWQYTRSSADHNEYYSISAPAQLGCGGGAELTCHNVAGGRGVRPPNGTMAEYCGTCHGNFHTLQTSNSSGIGPAAASPFIRHPSDLSIPSTAEFNTYNTYQVLTPVGRLAVPASSGSGRTFGQDTVFCLSCHVAHGSDYPDMLKWDYALQQVGNGGAASGEGCFACHSAKE